MKRAIIGVSIAVALSMSATAQSYELTAAEEEKLCEIAGQITLLGGEFNRRGKGWAELKDQIDGIVDGATAGRGLDEFAEDVRRTYHRAGLLGHQAYDPAHKDYEHRQHMRTMKSMSEGWCLSNLIGR